ncbi:MAG: GAF domain-containing protein [Patescibacteria group bacterium]
MINAPILANEPERLEALQKIGILDTPPEDRFDQITKEAIKLLKVPISTISIIDKDREWFKSCQGVTKNWSDRSVSFCGHALVSKDIFIIEDTLNDGRFKDNPAVIGPPFIRFYAGVPLYGDNDLPIGVFCIKDFQPRKVSLAEIDLILKLGAMAQMEINNSIKK